MRKIERFHQFQNLDRGRTLRVFGEAIREERENPVFNIVNARINETAKRLGLNLNEDFAFFTPETLIDLLSTLTGAMVATGNFNEILSEAASTVAELIATPETSKRIELSKRMVGGILDAMDEQDKEDRRKLRGDFLVVGKRKRRVARGVRRLAQLSAIGIFSKKWRTHLELIEASADELKETAKKAKKSKDKVERAIDDTVGSLEHKSKNLTRQARIYLKTLEEKGITTKAKIDMTKALRRMWEAVISDKAIAENDIGSAANSSGLLANDLKVTKKHQNAKGGVMHGGVQALNDALGTEFLKRVHMGAILSEVGAEAYAINNPMLTILILQITLNTIMNFLVVIQYSLAIDMTESASGIAEEDAKKALADIFANALEIEEKMREEELKVKNERRIRKDRGIVEGKVLSHSSGEKKK